MFGGGRGNMDPKRMQKMMNQMGIDIDEIDDVEEVVIRTSDKEYRFDDAQVTSMEADGQRTFQVVGNPEVSENEYVSDDDVELVSERAGVDEETARDALVEADGDLAQAISDLSE
ncbi:nascent polypeptide-associated complex protein [Halorutilales archaeon Cl-col2-1]